MEFLSDISIYRVPLREASFDKENKASLIDTDDQVYNFDKIAKFISKSFQPGNTISSCDALLELSPDQYILIEFKNQPEKNIKKDNIAKKAFQSFNLFRLVINQSLSVDQTRDVLTLFVVFRDDEQDTSFSAFRDKMHALAQLPENDSILFGLRGIQGKLYHKVYTLPKSEFLSDWYSQLFSGM